MELTAAFKHLHEFWSINSKPVTSSSVGASEDSIQLNHLSTWFDFSSVAFRFSDWSQSQFGVMWDSALMNTQLDQEVLDTYLSALATRNPIQRRDLNASTAVRMHR